MTTTKSFLGLSVVFAVVLFALAGVVHADTLYRQLDIGDRGSDVTSLQSWLATDVTLYPQGLVTGYFGNLSSAAVSRFQCRNNIMCSGSAATTGYGRVGPLTLSALNVQMSGGTSGGSAPIITFVGASTGNSGATVNWYTNEGARGVVYYSTSPLSVSEQLNSVGVSGVTAMTDTNFRSSQSVALSGLSANTTYHFLIYTTDQDGNVSVTWPSSFRTTN